MSYQPVVPFGGLSGWAFLQRTGSAQKQAFENSSQVVSDTEYFAARIGSITSAEVLVADRRLLSVALGAFGLSEEIDKKYLIKTVIAEGSINPQSLGNRLADKRYVDMAEAFGLDLDPPRNSYPGFADRIIERYTTRAFEVAVGQSNSDMRLAMTIERELPDLINRGLSDEALWFTIMANPPLRSGFEKALNLPPSVGALDIDRQLEIFRERATITFGSADAAQFESAEKRQELTRRFLAQGELSGQSGLTGANLAGRSAALAILQYG